ncbi:MAG TPA: Dabb family protein [Jiangellaceae bacterium]|nr:Dabb family protein [Jiangellaceae bacterium]
MIRHTVLFRWIAEATEAQIDGVLRRLAELPGQIPQIRRYEFGRDLGFSEGTWDMALVADFDTKADWEAYLNHPAHRSAVVEATGPITAELIRVQYEV